MNNNSILIKNLSKKFRKNEVLRNIELELEQSKIIGMVGQNGSGKTTLIRILSQLIPFDSGSIKLNGEALSDKSISEIGVYLCESTFYPNFTGLENLSYFLSLSEAKVLENRDLFISFCMEQAINKKYGSYSTGMKQRFGLIFLLMQKCNYLLLDEPMSNLDYEGAKTLKKELKKASKEDNKGVLIVSHHLEELDNLCDELIVIKDGVIKKIELTNKRVIEYDLVFNDSNSKNVFKDITNIEFRDLSDKKLRVLIDEEDMIKKIFTDKRINNSLTEVIKVKDNWQKRYIEFKGTSNYEE